MKAAFAVIPAGAEYAAVIAVSLAASMEPSWSAAAVASYFEAPGSFAFLAATIEPGHEKITQPLGFVLCRQAGDSCDIAAMSVAPSVRRRGIGRALIEAACAEAAKRGVREVFLEVAESNAPARALYVAQHFREVAKRAGYYANAGADRAEDAVVMRRDL